MKLAAVEWIGPCSAVGRFLPCTGGPSASRSLEFDPLCPGVEGACQRGIVCVAWWTGEL